LDTGKSNCYATSGGDPKYPGLLESILTIDRELPASLPAWNNASEQNGDLVDVMPVEGWQLRNYSGVQLNAEDTLKDLGILKSFADVASSSHQACTLGSLFWQ